LTREEWEKIKEYLDKSERGELTLEEVDGFLELARRMGEAPRAHRVGERTSASY
jgi:hypothetical protein